MLRKPVTSTDFLVEYIMASVDGPSVWTSLDRLAMLGNGDPKAKDSRPPEIAI